MRNNHRPNPDPILIQIADYVFDTAITNTLAYETAYMALLDSLACSMQALTIPACQKYLGPVISNIQVSNGSRVPGTHYELDPIKAAFDIGTTIRWLDYNDTWLAKEWGHPSDNLGALIAVGDYVCRNLDLFPYLKGKPLTVQDLLTAQIKAYEIQGILALDNAFNAVGLDHVLLVKIASAALSAYLLGFSKDQIIAALSEAFVDGGTLRVYRHAPNTGPRKSWAAGDATSRGVSLAWKVGQGDPGYPSGLTQKRWGFQDALFHGQTIVLARPLQSYVMENILFKVSFPAEFHAQTAVEAAITLHEFLKDKCVDGIYSKDKKISETILDCIDRIDIETQEAGFRIIHKEGPLHNYADRDHCLQYMIAMGLLFGELKAEHYQDAFANHPEYAIIIDGLRNKMRVSENPHFTQAYFDPDKRAIPNSIQIFFKDGTQSDKVTVYYPLGHRQRREEALLPLKSKYDHAIDNYFGNILGNEPQADNLKKLWVDSISGSEILNMPIDKFVNFWCI